MSVPAAATIYAQVLGSEALWNMHQLNPQQVIKDSNQNQIQMEIKAINRTFIISNSRKKPLSLAGSWQFVRWLYMIPDRTCCCSPLAGSLFLPSFTLNLKKNDVLITSYRNVTKTWDLLCFTFSLLLTEYLRKNPAC